MATVTGLTAERMEEIDGQSITNGEVVGNNLILKRRNNQTVDAGNVRGRPATGAKTRKLLLPAIKMNTNGPGAAMPWPVSPPTDAVSDVEWSPDGKFMAVVGSFGIIVYSFDGAKLTKVAEPALALSGWAQSVSWSPDGRFVTVGHGNAPYIATYLFNGTSLTKLDDPSVQPAFVGSDVSWSLDGRFLAVGHTQTPFVTVYEFDGRSIFTKVPNPEDLPLGGSPSVSWSPDGSHLAVAHNEAPFLSVYSFDGEQLLTKISNPASLPPGPAYTVEWSPDGRYLAVGHDNSPFLTVYSFNGSTLTKVANPTTLLTNMVYGLTWAPDSRHIVVNSETHPQTYFFENGSFGELFKRDVDSELSLSGPSWSPDGRFVGYGIPSYPYILVYKTFCTYFTDGTYTYAYR
jgi:WD40 repeat protein